MKRHISLVFLMAVAIAALGGLVVLRLQRESALKGCDMQAMKEKDWPEYWSTNVMMSDVSDLTYTNGGIRIRAAEPKQPTNFVQLDVRDYARSQGRFDYWWMLDEGGGGTNWFGVRPIQIGGLDSHLTNVEILATATIVQVGVTTNGARIYHFAP